MSGIDVSMRAWKLKNSGILDSDTGGLPGSTIESWNLTNLPTDNCGPCPLTTVISVGNPTLIAGNQYWIVATGGLQTFDNWSFTLVGSSFSPLATRSIKSGVDSGWVLSSPPIPAKVP
jgi:hypothetical protein